VTEMMKRLNAAAARWMVELGAHGCTDVTGFGLLGHLREMTAASGVDAVVDSGRVPVLEGALEHARGGDQPGGLGANRLFLGPYITLAEDVEPALADLLFDPQTSGGLLISLAPEAAERLVAALCEAGEPEAAVIGEFREGRGGIEVRR
jgi:selenide,water dikinase